MRARIGKNVNPWLVAFIALGVMVVNLAWIAAVVGVIVFVIKRFV